MAQVRRSRFNWRRAVSILVVLAGLFVLAQRLRDLLTPSHPQLTLNIIEIPVLTPQASSAELPGQFYVQVIDPTTADAAALVERLQQAGYRPTPVGSKDQSRALVGPYRSRAEAEAALDQLSTQLKMAP